MATLPRTRTLGALALAAALAPGCGGDLAGPTDTPAGTTSERGTIRGTVTIGDSPVIGAAVRASDGSHEYLASTRGDGTFRFAGLRPGDYTVAASASGVACEPRSVTVSAGRVAAADVACTSSVEFARVGIHVARADGSDVTWVAEGHRPAWSPDGRRIAFDRDGRVHVMDADGSNPRSLAAGVDPTWSPDGDRIAFADDGGLSVMDADGSGVTRLVPADFAGTSRSLGLGSPAWSPDGDRIAFNHLGDGDFLPAQIYVVDADGSGLRRVTSTGGIQYAESDPEWSPDGSTLLFWTYGFGLATVDPDGVAPPRTVYQNFPFVHYGAKPDWSPGGTGTEILFAAERKEARSGPGPFLYLGDMFLMDMGGDLPRLVLPGAYDPAWSPDGQRFAFVHGPPAD